MNYFGLILGAGKGTRMRPFSPKEMLPFVNKSIIVHSIDALKLLGVNHVNIVVGEGKYNIQEHVGDGKTFGVNVSYDFQQVLDGDAGGIKSANTARYSSADNVVVLFGDTLLSMSDDLLTLKTQFEHFKDDPNYAGAIAFKKLKAVIPDGSDKYPYGVALIDDELITSIYEKPSASLLRDFTNDGFVEALIPVYIFKKDVLFKIIDELYLTDVDGEYHLSDAIKLALSKGFKFSGHSIKGSLLDMGSPLTYLKALHEWFLKASDSDINSAAEEWELISDKFKNKK
ncbi:MAG: nucleotidyltransferase family protein [Candidatus Nanoarchaeia archaeon]|jgi:dTDP-glucose pyrophosphorylase